MKPKTKSFLFAALLVLFLIAMTALAVPVMTVMLKPEFQESLKNWVRDAGIWGVGALLLLQFAQVIVAFIPGEPVEVVAGAMYGTFGGLFICLFGLLVGSAAIFAVVRRLGRARLSRTKLYPKLMQYRFLSEEKRLEATVFLLYLIPGTPKDILVYVCALTGISMGRFLTISTLARIPSVITSTMAGASFMSGSPLVTLAIFVATGIAGLCGIAYHNKHFKAK